MMDGSHLLAVLAGQTTAALAASARPDAPVVEPTEARDPRVHGHRWWRTVWRVRRARGVEPSPAS